ncbi:6-phosphogluconolactonase [Pullulanibacillus camelliae]|uniref:6-phosphogluconolactonase n=1 Tax=Pullulanibacillus camelliae TaxID=1707096 RepID=A0A8J2YMS8_9BACL|nr:lactonase family protein [Pullulanibacillus camelliae]GGE53185.1 6-phosphogluconolactonase [Pullulanibacillus camelliae]
MIRGYVGTYTNGESQGIYTFELDPSAGQITHVKVAAVLDNPTYLNMTKDHRFLYSVIKDDKNGGVAAFSMDQHSGRLERINVEEEAGAPPCHVSLDDDRHLVFSTNYHKGTVASYRVNQETGGISAPVSVMMHEGSGPDPRQEKAHTHFAGLTPDGDYLAVCELGCDWLLTYTVKDSGELEEAHRLSVRPGSGPRHLVFHPKDPSLAYLITEFSSEVIVLSYEDGKFTEVQYISAVPADFEENNQASAIHISSDGRFVYAGNRGHNSIAIFSVEEKTGRLQLVERVSTEGEWPRDFVLDPTEKFLVASNQNSSNLVLFARDGDTGKLTLMQKDVHVPNPVCVKF